MPRPRTSTVHMRTAPARTNEHRTYVHMYMDMAQNQPKLTADWFTLRTSAAHTPAASASKKRPMQEGPMRSGWKGLVPVNFRMATDRPHIPVVQPHSPTQMGWGTGAPTRASKPITHSQRALPPRATSVVNPDTSSATAPTRTLRQTTAAVP